MSPLLPGATIGVLGSGQLGRMLALTARRMGYRIHVYSPARDTPAGRAADLELCAPYDDHEALARFAAGVDAVTLEFENIPGDALDAVLAEAPVHPSPAVLRTCQNRLREKTFLQERGFPLAPFRAVSTPAELDAALAELGTPAVLKTAGFGYDGKGQVRLNGAAELAAARAQLEAGPCVLEGFIDFEREVSVVAARGQGGELRDHGVIENRHVDHILDLSLAPAGLPAALVERARTLACELLVELDAVGVVAVEMFVTRAGELLVNEIAPRPHNSGHLTIEACVSHQFEQQLRALCGLPLGDGSLVRPAAMANLLGDLWRDGEPDWAAALADGGVKLHLYGKAEARPGRKMGHLTATAASAEAAADAVLRARRALAPRR